MRDGLTYIINRIGPGAIDAATDTVTPEREHPGKGAMRLIVSKAHTTVTLAL